METTNLTYKRKQFNIHINDKKKPVLLYNAMCQKQMSNNEKLTRSAGETVTGIFALDVGKPRWRNMKRTFGDWK